MTISTNLASRFGNEEFSRRPATTRFETALTIATGAAISVYGAVRRDWFGAALAAGGGYLLYAGVRDLRKPYQGRVRVGFTIAREPNEVYEFVRNPENWDVGLHGVKFEIDGSGLSLRFNDGKRYTLNSELHITEDKPGEYIAWASDPHMIEHRGVLHFKKAPGDRGTELSMAFEYKAPTGPISQALASFAGFDPEQLARESLRKIKQIMETGEVPTTTGQAVGARGLRGAAKRVMFRERPAIEVQPERLAGD